MSDTSSPKNSARLSREQTAFAVVIGQALAGLWSQRTTRNVCPPEGCTQQDAVRVDTGTMPDAGPSPRQS